ncbi:MAG: hypothetical protein QG656_2675, partial [Candidatus Hydrogenedentes bacterium]|nr:hypothetical protein [Candidatus Hydrogenedentota bacterium]
CLKCIDAPGLDQPWNPHFYYQPGLHKGTICGSFDIRLEPGAIVTHEWRDQHSPYRVGPSLIFDGANKQLQANGKTVLELPADTWLHIEITCPLKEGKYTLTVTTQGQEPKTIPDIATDNPEFRALDWCGFISNAQTSVAWYLDNVKIEEQ